MKDIFGIEASGCNPVGVVCSLLSLSQGRPKTANPGLEAFHPVGVNATNSNPRLEAFHPVGVRQATAGTASLHAFGGWRG